MFYSIFIASFLFLGSVASFSESPTTPWGADAELTTPLSLSSPLPQKTPQKLCVKMIRFFQKHISPIDGPRSHFYPTSSQYALLAIQKYGVFKGIALGCDRLMRENQEKWIYPLKEGRKLDPVK